MASPASFSKELPTVEVFYAHADWRLCKELDMHLSALKRAGLISSWYDRKIEPGSEWSTEIQEAMERAGIILLMVSAKFLASIYVSTVELPYALKRHDSNQAVVVPILLRPVLWKHEPFAKLNCLPSGAWERKPIEVISVVHGALRSSGVLFPASWTLRVDNSALSCLCSSASICG